MVSGTAGPTSCQYSQELRRSKTNGAVASSSQCGGDIDRKRDLPIAL
jgi:hypothetical protein